MNMWPIYAVNVTGKRAIVNFTGDGQNKNVNQKEIYRRRTVVDSQNARRCRIMEKGPRNGAGLLPEIGRTLSMNSK